MINRLTQKYPTFIEVIQSFNPVDYEFLEYKDEDERLAKYLIPRVKVKLTFKDEDPLIVWVCKEYKRKAFCAISEEEYNNLKEYENLHKTHFGIDYIDHKNFYLNLNKEQFLEEYESKLGDPRFPYIDKPERTEKVLTNFSVNMNYFKSLDKCLFNKHLDLIVNKYHFKEIFDLNDVGYDLLYLMVLDGYCQFYVGKTDDYLIYRIKRHWADKVDPFRYFWSAPNNSRLSIDHFRILDTTRIFVCEDYDLILKENADEINESLGETNLFLPTPFKYMSKLEIAERIVIMNSPIKYSLNDRVPLPVDNYYEKIEKKCGLDVEELLIKHYIFNKKNSH